MSPDAGVHPSWRVERSRGPAGAFHARPIPEAAEPAVWIHDVSAPALVLGSTQDDGLVDRERAGAGGVEVCRRRSGGGLVGLWPDAELWVDVVVPRASSLWSDDVSVAFSWLGRAWAEALGEAGVGRDEVAVHRGPMIGAAIGRLVCFAGLGPGEVTVDGAKIVGISQRRTRHAARFQCAAILRWDPAWVVPLVDGGTLAAAGIDLVTLPVGLPPDRERPPRERVLDALLRSLPPADGGGGSPVVDR